MFTVAGIGLISGLGNDVNNAVLVRLDDARLWLEAPDEAERLLVVWNSDTGAGSDAKATVSHARNTGQNIKVAVEAQLGPDYKVSLPKYKQLDQSSQGFIFEQIFITLYGLLSMGIVGLMVNALMVTTVTEQKHDLAVFARHWRTAQAFVPNGRPRGSHAGVHRRGARAAAGSLHQR